MTTKPDSSTEAAAECDFVISRVLDAPRDLVFNAWTDPKRMAQWWGPHNFTTPVCNLEPRPGGAYRLVMRGPDGSDHPLKGIYREVARPERLVMTMDHSELPEAWHDRVNANRGKENRNAPGDVVSTVTFETLDAGTKLTIRTRFESAAIRDAMVRLGMNGGWSQSLERLAAVVTKPKPFARYLPVIARILMGLMFFVFGLNGFLHFIPEPKTPMPEDAIAFAGALMKTGYMFPMVMGTQLLVGVLLLLNRFVPLALALIAPVVVNIIAFHVFLAPSGIGPGLVVLALELYLASAYRNAFRTMLAMRANPD